VWHAKFEGQEVAVKINPIMTLGNHEDEQGLEEHGDHEDEEGIKECEAAREFFKRDSALFMNCIHYSAEYKVYTYMGSINLQDVNTIDVDKRYVAGLREHRMSNGLPNFLQNFKDPKALSAAEKKQIVKQVLQMLVAMMSKPALMHGDIWAENIVVRQRDQDGIKVGLVDYGLVSNCSDMKSCIRPHFFDEQLQMLASSDTLRFVTQQILDPLMVSDPLTAYFKDLVEAPPRGQLVASDWSDQHRITLGNTRFNPCCG